MVVTCVIEFDNNPYGTYFAGQIVMGRITLTSDKPKHVKAISLTINGYAETHWSETSSDKKDTSKKFYGREDYIASLTYLLGSNASASNVTIEPGVHTYQFACQLPLTCPSSFECFNGHIRYKVKVALIRPWKFDQTFTRLFTVLKVLDLNYDSPLLRMPAHNEVEKVYCCWPCRTDPLQIRLSVPQTGYVPGQVIPVGVLIANETRIPVEELKIRLAMIVCLYSQGPNVHMKQERIVVAKVKGDPVMQHCKKEFVYELRAPATPPTCFNLCKIIQIAYEIEVEAKVKGWHINGLASIPITIGSVPLMNWNNYEPNVIEQQPRISEQHQELQVSEQSINATNTRPVPWEVDSNISPPSYAEAVYMPHANMKTEQVSSDNKSEEYGETDFTPLYPVFDIPSPIAPSIENDRSLPKDTAAAQNKGTWL